MVATGSLLSIASACLYAGAGHGILSRLWKRGGKAPASWVIAAAAAALLHALFLVDVIFCGSEIHFGFGPAVSTALLYAAVASLAVSFARGAGPVTGLLLPLASLSVLLPLAFPGSPMLTQVWTPLFTAHIAIALFVYSLLLLALLQAILMELLNKRFRSGIDPIPETGPLSNMPPILVAERHFFCTLQVCFLVLTALLAAGVLVTQESFGVNFVLGHKTYLTWISWVLLAVLLVGRRMFGWRGRKALNWFWWLLIAYGLAYLGYTFILENFLH